MSAADDESKLLKDLKGFKHNDSIVHLYNSLLTQLQTLPSKMEDQTVLQQPPPRILSELPRFWKEETRATFVVNDATNDYKHFFWVILTDIIIDILSGTQLYNMEMMLKITSFLTEWEEGAYPGIVHINKDEDIYKLYYDILLRLYESRRSKLIKSSMTENIFENDDGSLNLGNTPIMAIIRDMICGCKRGTECDRKNSDHLTLMHRLRVSPGIRDIYTCRTAYPSKGGRRRKTQYRKKTKSSNRKTQKKSRKQRS
jgi:hypothetical protein